MRCRGNSFPAILVVLALAGCEEGKRPLLQAQFCLPPEDVPEFERLLRSIARDEGMDFLRQGARAEKLKTPQSVTENGSTVLLPHGIQMAVSTPDDVEGFSATVSGYPSNQVSMGFSPGRHPRVAMAFAKRVITRLRQKWDVRLISGDVGMFPLKDCR